MDIKDNIEEWKRIYESSLDRNYSLKYITEARKADDDDDDDEDSDQEDSEELKADYGEYYKDTKNKFFLDVFELYYVPKKGEDPFSYVTYFDDWYNSDKLKEKGSFKVFDQKTLKFNTLEEAKKELVKRFSELRSKYKDISVENFKIIDDDDVPNVFKKVDPKAQGFIYNYIPWKELTKDWGDSSRKFTDGKETHTLDGWAKKLGITYQQFAKAVRDGYVWIKKDKDGNKIEPYMIDGSKYKETETPLPDTRRRFQNPDKSVMMFIYFIYQAPHQVQKKSALFKLGTAFLKLNSSPQYYSQIQQKMRDNMRRQYKDQVELKRNVMKNDVDDDVGSEWKRSKDMDQDEMDARRADAMAKDDKTDYEKDLEDLNLYDLNTISDKGFGDSDDYDAPADDTQPGDTETPDGYEDEPEDEDNYDSSDDSSADEYDYSFKRSGDGSADYSDEIEDFVNDAADNDLWAVITYKTMTSKPTMKTFDDEGAAMDYVDEIQDNVEDLEVYDNEGNKVDTDKMFG
jgi:hypothetical protein